MDQEQLLNLIGKWVKLDDVVWQVVDVVHGHDDQPPALVLVELTTGNTIVAPLPKVEQFLKPKHLKCGAKRWKMW